MSKTRTVIPYNNNGIRSSHNSIDTTNIVKPKVITLDFDTLTPSDNNNTVLPNINNNVDHNTKQTHKQHNNKADNNNNKNKDNGIPSIRSRVNSLPDTVQINNTTNNHSKNENHNHNNNTVRNTTQTSPASKYKKQPRIVHQVSLVELNDDMSLSNNTENKPYHSPRKQHRKHNKSPLPHINQQNNTTNGVTTHHSPKHNKQHNHKYSDHYQPTTQYNHTISPKKKQLQQQHSDRYEHTNNSVREIEVSESKQAVEYSDEHDDTVQHSDIDENDDIQDNGVENSMTDSFTTDAENDTDNNELHDNIDTQSMTQSINSPCDAFTHNWNKLHSTTDTLQLSASVPTLNMHNYSNNKPAIMSPRINSPRLSLCSSTGKTSLHSEIVDIARSFGPTVNECKQRSHILQCVVNEIQTLWSDVDIHVIGSCATGLFLQDSDIDLVIKPLSTHRTLTLGDMYALETQLRPMSDTITTLSTASVPVIKMTYVIDTVKYAIDITFNAASGLQSTQLVQHYIQTYPILKPLAIMLKRFLRTHGCNDLYKGGLPSFALVVMLVHYCQFYHSETAVNTPTDTDESQHTLAQHIIDDWCDIDCIDVMSKIDPELDLGIFVCEFFKLFGLTFDYGTMGISVLGSGTLFAKRSRQWYYADKPYLLCIESPIDPTFDLGYKVFNIQTIKHYFAEAYHELARIHCEPTDSNNNTHTTLQNGTPLDTSIAATTAHSSPKLLNGINTFNHTIHNIPMPSDLNRRVSSGYHATNTEFNVLPQPIHHINGYNDKRQQQLFNRPRSSTDLQQFAEKTFYNTRMNGSVTDLRQHGNAPKSAPLHQNLISLLLLGPQQQPLSNVNSMYTPYQQI